MTRDEILALAPEELEAHVAEHLGWRVIQDGTLYIWAKGGYPNCPTIPYQDVKERISNHQAALNGCFLWARRAGPALEVFAHIVSNYGGCAVLGSREWESGQVQAMTQSVESGIAPLPIALCRLLLLLAERDKESQERPAPRFKVGDVVQDKNAHYYQGTVQGYEYDEDGLWYLMVTGQHRWGMLDEFAELVGEAQPESVEVES